MGVEESIKLDKIDKKILYNLDIDSKQPLSKLSRKLRTSRSVINYKLRRMEKEGLIQNYVAFVNPGKLGLMIWNVCLQFHNTTQKLEESVKKYVKNKKNIWWAAKTTGNWDFIYSVVVKDIKELEIILREFNSLFGNYILKQVVVAHGEVDIISRSYLKNVPGKTVKWFEKYELISLDKKEKKILSLLGSSARMNVLELSKKTNLDPKTIVSKIKKLEKNGVICRYRLHLDVSKIGLCFYKVILHVKNYSEEKDKELSEYCRELGNVFHYERKIGSWPLELEMDVKSYEEADDIMYKMKEKFPDFIERYELLLIKDEIKGELDLTKLL